MGLSPQNLQLVRRVFQYICPFSIATNVGVTICVVKSPPRQTSIGYMQCFLSLAEVMVAISFVVGSHIAESDPGLCTFFGILTQYFFNAASCWNFLCSLYCSLAVSCSYKIADQYWYQYNVYGWGLPLLLTISVFIAQQVMGGTSNVMGDATYECWISYEYQDLRIWLYYCWLWIHFVGIIAVYTQIFFRIQKTSRGINQLSTAGEGHVSNNLIDNPHHSSRALKSIKSFSGMEDSVMLASSTDGITNSSPLHSNPQILSSPSYHKSVLLPSHQLRKGQESKRLLLENPSENSTIHRPNASMNGNSVAAKKLSHSRMKLILKTSVIAFGFILSWTPATAKRIILLESPYSDIPEWLSVWMGVGLAFSGVWNAAAFFVGVLWDYWYL